jgi:integrase/recombinase XerD
MSWCSGRLSRKRRITVRSYTDSVKGLCAFLEAEGIPSNVEGVDVSTCARSCCPRSGARLPSRPPVHFRNLRVFFGWLVREEERPAPSPMDRVDKPKVSKKAKAFFDGDELARLLKACQGSTFEDRRDTALMRILIDTGMRVSGLANLRYDPDDDAQNDVFLTQRRLRIRLKGGDETWVPIGKKAAAAVDRYIRVRARHPHASSPWLWLGWTGRVSPT